MNHLMQKIVYECSCQLIIFIIYKQLFSLWISRIFVRWWENINHWKVENSCVWNAAACEAASLNWCLKFDQLYILLLLHIAVHDIMCDFQGREFLRIQERIRSQGCGGQRRTKVKICKNHGILTGWVLCHQSPKPASKVFCWPQDILNCCLQLLDRKEITAAV